MRIGNVIVAGHLCLDIFPGLSHLQRGEFASLFKPGHLLEVGPAVFSTGGAVSNTGLALHCLGIPTRLVAKVGADPFGQIVLDIIHSYGRRPLSGIITDPAVTTSYTVIVNPPGVDRIFLHCPGANETFSSADIGTKLVARANLFHFGYPPLVRRFYQAGGKELVETFRRAKETGVTTSLDLSLPDPSSESGGADWAAILRAALPYVDVFVPSIEELLFALRRETFERLQAAARGGNLLSLVTPGLLTDISGQLLEMGVKIAGIKLGDRGFYLRTGSHSALDELGRARPADVAAWADKELWAPCFKVNVVGTTGAGDATIAGFISALLRNMLPEEAAIAAVGVGACNVEAADALSGLRSWDETMERIESGWEQRVLTLDAPGWQFDACHHLWVAHS